MQITYTHSHEKNRMINLDLNSETIQLIAWLTMTSSIAVASVISIAYAVSKYWDRDARHH